MSLESRIERLKKCAQTRDLKWCFVVRSVGPHSDEEVSDDDQGELAWVIGRGWQKVSKKGEAYESLKETN